MTKKFRGGKRENFFVIQSRLLLLRSAKASSFFLSTFFHDYALIGFVFPYVSALRVGFWFRRFHVGEGSKRIMGKVAAPVLCCP